MGESSTAASQSSRLHVLLALGLTGAVCYLLFVADWNRRDSAFVAAEYSLIFLGSHFLIRLGTLFCNVLPKPSVPKFVPELLVGLSVFAVIVKLGQMQFGGYDQSMLVEAGWLQLSTLKPFLDYPITLPPLFFAGAGWAFKWFGIQWSSFVILNGLFAVLAYIVLLRQLGRIGFGRLPAIGVTVMAELGTLVVSSYWWHNPLSSIAVILVFLSCLSCLRPSPGAIDWILLSLSVTLCLLLKPNSWPAILCVASLFSSRSTRIWAAVSLLTSVVAAWMFCSVNGLPLAKIFLTYRGIAKAGGSPLSLRGFTDYSFIESFVIMYATYLLARKFGGSVFSNRGSLTDYIPETACCVIAGVTSLYMSFTNAEIVTSNLAPLLIAFLTFSFRPWKERQLLKQGRAFLVFATVAFCFASVLWGLTRQRVRAIGQDVFFQSQGGVQIDSGFMKGMNSGPRLKNALKEIGRATREHPGRMFLGPRMEFGYAAFRLPPPEGLPIWWHSGISYLPDQEPSIESAFVSDHFDTLIFLRNDATRVPEPIIRYITENYKFVEGYSELSVLVRIDGKLN